MFKFDFHVEAESDSPFAGKSTGVEKPISENVVDSAGIDWYEAEEVVLDETILENVDLYRLNATELRIGEVSLMHIVSGYLLQHLKADDGDSTDISKAEETHSDLIPGIYEGGAKIWECTMDLLNYLTEHYTPQQWLGKCVLDLGCGSGLLGLYAYKCGATVHFQDYNKDVLQQITLPNLLLNATAADSEEEVDVPKLSKQVKCFAGDWAKYAALQSAPEKFDFILTSETIYNGQNHQKLLDTLHAKLTPAGVVLVAAKTYYFGVGGGVRQFEALVANDGRFQMCVQWSTAEGVGREILELKRRYVVVSE